MKQKSSRPAWKTACDRCSEAKVKCTYEEARGACVRCARKSAACTKSPPAPRGRIPNAGKKANSSEPKLAGELQAEPSTPEHLIAEPLAHPELYSPQTAQTMDLMRLALQPGDGLWGDSACSPLAIDSCFPALSCPDRGIPWTPTSHDVKEVGPAPTALAEDLSGQTTYAPWSYACVCYEALVRAVDGMQRPSAEKRLLDSALCAGKEALNIIKGFLACKSAHEASAFFLLYLLMHKVICSYSEASAAESCSARSESRPPYSAAVEIRVGSYIVEREDDPMLKRRIIDLHARRLRPLLEQVELRMKPLAQGCCWSMCAIIQKFVQEEADLLLKRTTDFAGNESGEVNLRLDLSSAGVI
ncbi:hypothetical protein B0J12DRAFT_693892 [Macrophomina phaseolina]|uniref:Zn(2)-C6 fungal-type domain-containing protein n=1 Tax=Macrophomina phaseolina TaxID=35725 RepID=A0ABQ8GWE8_9PEZI|nr:hypothetical protein B0J12DRAFT_693892 [Macrophomina phaseolina]